MCKLRLIFLGLFFGLLFSVNAAAQNVLESHHKGELSLQVKKRSSFEGLSSFLSGKVVPVQCAVYLKPNMFRGKHQVAAECRGENPTKGMVNVRYHTALFAEDGKLLGTLSHSSKRESRREGMMKSGTLLLTEAQVEKVGSFSFVLYEEAE